MMRSVIFFLLLPCLTVHSQEFYAAPMQAMGNTGLAIPSIYNLTVNGAVISDLKRPKIALAYQPHFLSNDIRLQALFLALPLQKSNRIGFAMNNYGLRGTSSLSTLRAIYGRSFGSFFSTSVSTNYHQYHVKGYGSDRALSVDLGLHFKLNEMFAFGFLWRNISSSHFDDTIDQYISKEMGVGLMYRLSQELLLATDLYCHAMREMEARMGVAYDIDGLVVLRAGITSRPLQYFAGLGVDLGNFIVDISSGFHTQIGLSPQIALSYGF